ncbi:Bacterial extracellular solute-binding protein [Acididesulfobacillus acetoxydans]|uniref:Bacterial extracellular solute-binding protein n=1 Tax=Acididesulfobacillus acetoxydans TaxID=1561005 RepID=A0A8S0XVI8_9FIRM|nr:Bacterial extracellular solute-binding protein [Acididesulfobacillus acetoxydans]CEJ07889.1 Fe3+ ABC transporter substrate-binding protein [Acididesulfobacillus acetoxydans]
MGITYNTKEIKTPPRDWQDALAPAFKNKVVMPDPAQSGSALDFTGAYLQNHQNSWDFFKALKANGAIVQGANAESLNQVLTGAKSMVLAGVDYMAYADKAKGEPIDIVYPSSGTVVNPRPVMILKSAKNLTAAKKYVDFLLSSEGQQDVVNAYLLPGRKDISVGSKRAALDEIKQFQVDWKALTSDEKNVIHQADSILGQ